MMLKTTSVVVLIWYLSHGLELYSLSIQVQMQFLFTSSEFCSHIWFQYEADFFCSPIFAEKIKINPIQIKSEIHEQTLSAIFLTDLENSLSKYIHFGRFIFSA